MLKRSSFLLLLLFGTYTAYGQLLEWKVGAFGFADNREYVKAGLYSQSILGIRMAPEVGILLDSTHRLRAGIDFLQEFGAKPFGAKVLPIVYYQYQHAGLSFFIGAFPRVHLKGDYPKALLNDTLLYDRPNMEGLFFQYRSHSFHEQVWVDWTSRQTHEQREQFMVGLSGKIAWNSFFLTHALTMLHTANTLDGDYPVRDNAAGLLQLGIDLNQSMGLDSLTVAAGVLASLDRIRGVYGARTPKGFIAEVKAAYKAWFVHDTFYKGQAHHIIFGDRFYTKDTYNRLDLGWKPFNKGHVEGSFVFSLHFTPGQISNQQMIQLRYRFGQSLALN